MLAGAPCWGTHWLGAPCRRGVLRAAGECSGLGVCAGATPAGQGWQSVGEVRRAGPRREALGHHSRRQSQPTAHIHVSTGPPSCLARRNRVHNFHMQFCLREQMCLYPTTLYNVKQSKRYNAVGAPGRCHASPGQEAARASVSPSVNRAMPCPYGAVSRT